MKNGAPDMNMAWFVYVEHLLFLSSASGDLHSSRASFSLCFLKRKMHCTCKTLVFLMVTDVNECISMYLQYTLEWHSLLIWSVICILIQLLIMRVEITIYIPGNFIHLSLLLISGHINLYTRKRSYPIQRSDEKS